MGVLDTSLTHTHTLCALGLIYLLCLLIYFQLVSTAGVETSCLLYCCAVEMFCGV